MADVFQRFPGDRSSRGRSNAAVRMYRQSIVIGTANLLAKAIAQAPQGLESTIVGLGRSLEMRRMGRERMHVANLSIARAAQQAVVAGWQSRLPRHSNSYRPEDRLTGMLGEALADPSMTDGTSDRVISFVNTETLGRMAPHWYRVNYGAGAGGGREAESFEVLANQRPMGIIRDELEPAPYMWLPRVFRWEDNGDFTPLRGPARPVEASARAAHFLDLGIKVVASETGNVYQNIFNAYVDERKQAARKLLSREGIKIVGDLRLERVGWTVGVHRST